MLLILAASTLFLPERKKLPGMAGWWFAGNLAALPFLLSHLKNTGVWSIDSIASTDISAFLAPWGSSILMGWMRQGGVHPEAALWPGLAAIAGSIWFLFKGEKIKWDIFLLACILFFTVFSLGPTLVAFGRALAPAPFRFFAKLPGCSSIRLPARAAIFALVPLVIFAGRKLGDKPMLAIVGILLAAATVWHPPLRTIALRPQPWHQWITEQHFNKILYLPISSDMDMPQVEARRLISSIPHFTPSLNGYSTTLPDNYVNCADVLNGWLSDNAKLLIRELEIDCIILKGWQTFEADTVFFTDGMSVSVVMPDLRVDNSPWK